MKIPFSAILPLPIAAEIIYVIPVAVLTEFKW